MREIKFRGQRVYNKEWVYGYYTEWWFSDHIGYAIIDYESPSIVYVVIPETVGQFTGLKDKNGNEIYEGDTLKDENVGTIEWGCLLSVYGWVLKTQNDVYCNLYSHQYMEIIGNIHQQTNQP